MTKKILYSLSFLLEFLLLGGSYAVHYFTVKRMGMARHVIYLNSTWEKKFPVSIMIFGAMAIIAALFLVNLMVFLKKRPYKNSLPGFELAGSLILTTGFVGFGLAFNTMEIRAYYLVMILLFLAVLLQNFKAMMVLHLSRTR